MAGETVNYYYLGHLLLALPAHALSLEPSVAYNLAVAGLFALSASAVVHARGDAVGGRAGARRARRRRAGRGRARGGRARCSCSATSRARASGCGADGPPGDYDWFAVSRVIPDTINEIPSFSFTLGDLHAHVLAIPFTLLALAFALQVALDGPRGDLALARGGRGARRRARGRRAVRDQLVVVSGRRRAAGRRRRGVDARARGARAAARSAAVWTVLVLLAGFVLVLPFWLDFDPAARGIGWVDERRSFSAWAGDMALIYGVLGWALVAAYVGPAAGGAAARADRGLGRGRRRVRALAARAGRPRRRRAAARRARASRCTPRCTDAARGARALPLAARSRARRRACSRPSSSTCATSSTTASCTG